MLRKPRMELANWNVNLEFATASMDTYATNAVFAFQRRSARTVANVNPKPKKSNALILAPPANANV